MARSLTDDAPFGRNSKIWTCGLVSSSIDRKILRLTRWRTCDEGNANEGTCQKDSKCGVTRPPKLTTRMIEAVLPNARLDVTAIEGIGSAVIAPFHTRQWA